VIVVWIPACAGMTQWIGQFEFFNRFLHFGPLCGPMVEMTKAQIIITIGMRGLYRSKPDVSAQPVPMQAEKIRFFLTAPLHRSPCCAIILVVSKGELDVASERDC